MFNNTFTRREQNVNILQSDWSERSFNCSERIRTYFASKIKTIVFTDIFIFHERTYGFLFYALKEIATAFTHRWWWKFNFTKTNVWLNEWPLLIFQHIRTQRLDMFYRTSTRSSLPCLSNNTYLSSIFDSPRLLSL